MVRKDSAMTRSVFIHIRNAKSMDYCSFDNRAHLTSCGSLELSVFVRVLHGNAHYGAEPSRHCSVPGGTAGYSC